MVDINTPNLSLQAVAERLDVSYSLVYAECQRGKLQHHVIGGSERKRGAIRCSERQLADYLSGTVVAQTREPATPPPARETAVPSRISKKLNRLMR